MGIIQLYPKIVINEWMDAQAGPKADSELTPENATIEGIFGLFDIELNKEECNKDTIKNIDRYNK